MVQYNLADLVRIFGHREPFSGCRGSIVRLYIEDFMTYHKVELMAGANVNLIMGPNGTGKSTIVCAICLGLAGKPTILGRATSLKAYIRHGTKKAIIEIELYNPSGENWVVKRVIKETDNSATSFWILNERKTSPESIKKLMASLNIQLDNLCQFLPQDRVQEFAKMDSVLLLQSTEQAIGSDTLAKKHEALISINKSIRQLEYALKNHVESLRVEEQKNQRVETEVEAFQQRERLKNTIAELVGKKAWFQYIKAMAAYDEVNREVTNLNQQKAAAEKSIAPLQKLVRILEQTLIKYRERMSKLRAENLSKSNLIQRKFNSDKEANDIKVNEIEAQLNQTIRSEDSKSKRLQAALQRIQSFEEELADLLADGEHDVPTLQAKITELEEAKSNLVRQIVDIQFLDEQDEIEKAALNRRMQTSQSELNQLQDLRVSRMRFIQQNQRDLFKAVKHFENEENHAPFKGKIHEPMILHVYVNDLRYGKVAERFIGMSDLTAYFCENRDDVRTLIEITEKLGLRVSVIHHPAPTSFRKPPTSITPQQFKKFHFQKVLVDLLEAPEYYLSYLCKSCANKNCGKNCNCRMAKPENVPIGTAATDKVISEVMAQTSLKYCYTDDFNYSIQTSYYSGKKNSSINFLQSARVFTDQINRNEREKLELAIRTARENYERLTQNILSRADTLQGLIQEKQKVEKDIGETRTKIDYIHTLESKIASTKLTAEAITREKVDLNAVRKKATADSLKARMTLFKSIEAVADTVSELSANAFKHNVLKRQVSILHSRSIAKSSQYEEAKVTVDEYLGQIREMNGKLRAAQDQAERCKKEAVAKSRLDKAPQEVSSGEVDEDTIEKELNLNTAQLNFLADTNPNVIRDYQQRKRLIEDMSKSKAEKEAELVSLQTQMASLKVDWLEPLTELINRIDTNFSKFFASMQCAGQIFLDKGEDESDFAKYGIKIKVKFRASEQLTELSGWKQSGGERAITTALYVLALQELTTVPFRVIDEINQGMDAKNEARFFNLLCSLANGASTPQYFLLTPKMLPPVTYPDNVDFHFILNGPHIDLPMRGQKRHLPIDFDLDDGDDDDVDA